MRSQSLRSGVAGHPAELVTALAVVRPGLAVSGDLDGGVCSWERGRDTALAFREPKASLPVGQCAVTAIAVAGEQVLVREGNAGFLVLDARTLALHKRLPHKGSEAAVSGDGVVVATGGKLAQAFRAGTWERVAVREKLGASTEGVAAVPHARAISFRDAKGAAGLLSTETLETVATRTFAAVPLRYGVEVDPTGGYIAVECADASGSACVKVWSRATGELVTLDGVVEAPRFVRDELVVANSHTGTATEPPGRRLSFHSLARGDLGRKIREIDTRSLGPGVEWVRLAAVRDDVLVLVARGVILVCGSTGTVRARLPTERQVLHVAFDQADLVVATDDGRVCWRGLGA